MWAAVNLADTEVQAPNMALAAAAVPAKVTGTKPKLPPRPRAVVGQQDRTFARPRAPALGKAALSSRLPRGGGAAISPIDPKAMESPSPAETTRDLEGANVTRSLDNSETEPLEKTQSMNKTRPVDNTKVNETLPVNKTSCVNKTKSMNDSKSLNSTSTHSSSKVPRMKLTRSGAAEKPGNASRKPKLQSCNATVTKPSQDKTSTLISKPGRTSLTSNSSDQSSNTSAKKSLKTSQLRVNIYKNTSQARTGKSLKTSTSNPLETSKPQETSQSTKTSQPMKTSQPTKTSQHTKTSQSTKTSQPVKTSQPLKTSNINSRKPKGTSLPSPSESPSLQVTSTKPHGLVQVQRQVPQVARSLGARPKVTRPQVAGSQVTRPQLVRSQVARPQPAGRRSLASSRESLDSREAGRPAVPSSTSSTRQPRRSTSTLSDNLAAERSREPLERPRGEVWRLGRGMEALAVLVGWQQGKVEEALRRSVQERRACEEVKEVLRRVKQEHRQEQAEAEALVERLGREMEDMVEQQEQEQCAREEARQQAEFTRVEEVEKKKHEEVKRMQEEAKMTARAMQASNAEKEALRGKVKQLEAKVAALVVSVMEGPGERRDAAMVQLKQEVESLTAVLDLRTREVKAAQEAREVLEAKVVDFEATKGLVRTLRNQVEDLKAQVETTRTLERSMEAEVVRLQSSLVKESREKRNISMENEQLEWKVRVPPRECRGSSVSPAQVREGTPLACRRRQARQLENRSEIEIFVKK